MLSRKTPLKRTGSLNRSRLSPMSAKRRKESAIYAKKRKAFLAAHPWCQWFLDKHFRDEKDVLHGLICLWGGAGWEMREIPVPRSCDIHHKAGRTGANYLDESTWMAVSREAHEWIHSHPKEARAKGWLK